MFLRVCGYLSLNISAANSAVREIEKESQENQKWDKAFHEYTFLPLTWPSIISG